jgi:hypothetical protein
MGISRVEKTWFKQMVTPIVNGKQKKEAYR